MCVFAFFVLTGHRDLKQDRLNRAKQLKEQKRNDLFLQRRIGEAAGVAVCWCLSLLA